MPQEARINSDASSSVHSCMAAKALLKLKQSARYLLVVPALHVHFVLLSALWQQFIH